MAGELVRNHALVDGNERLGLAAIIAFYGLNGRRLTLSNDAAYELVMADIAAVLRRPPSPGDFLRSWPPTRPGLALKCGDLGRAGP